LKRARKALIPAVVLAAVSATGASFAATQAPTIPSSLPRVSVETTLRHEPPELEVGAVVAVEGLSPKPLGYGVKVLFDREGNIDRPELFLCLGRPGQVDAGCSSFRSEYTDDPNPSPTNGRVWDFAIDSFDEACNRTGLC
jgi:hypothetical protein